MIFEPIAIVGQGCVLPGALSPAALWDVVRNRRTVLAPVPESHWRLAPGVDRARLKREVASSLGGFVSGFESVWDPNGFAIDPAALAGLDEAFLWPLHAARQALVSAGLDPAAGQARGTVVLGNLGYPTSGLVDLAVEVWSGAAPRLDRRNRFMSGLPAHLLAEAVGFRAGAFALDAACASSLYAIKLACDRLHDRVADVALAGGVNHADDLFLHLGFTALRALSPTGQSRPFHRDADGLIPAQGAALVVLKRLDDAVAAGDKILGVIRGLGLTNDGRSRGLLVPGEDGQVRALTTAWQMSGLDPRDLSLMECHATGTSVGDATEIRSMRRVFDGAHDVPVGSLKSNLGHLVTASGAAALLKVLAALDAGVRPPTLHADAPLDELAGGPFRVLHTEEPWDCARPRIAAVSNFGFGGNNAHLVVEEWAPEVRRTARLDQVSRAPAPLATDDIAVVARAVVVGASEDLSALFRESGASVPDRTLPDFDLELVGLRFPPADLRDSLPQQLLLLRAGARLGPALAGLVPERTGLFVGMQTDAEIARFAVRWVHPGSENLPGGQLSVASVVGCMPNILANRLSHQFDLRGPCFTVSSEEVSGTRALELAVRGLKAHELDAAVVGAIDLAAEPVHRAAASAILPEARREPGDAAVLLVLKRYADAVRDGDTVLAVIATSAPAPGFSSSLSGDEPGLTPRFGHAHAASGLVHVAAAIEACHRRALPTERGVMPWLPSRTGRRARVDVDALGGQSTTTYLRADPVDPARVTPVFLRPPPRLELYTAADAGALADAVARREPAPGGAFRLAVASENPTTHDARLDRAAALLRAPGLAAGALEDGAFFGAGPMAGELAFVFTGPAGAYTGMGRDLALAFPDLVDRLGARLRSLRESAGWVFEAEPGYQAEPIDKLWGAAYLAQTHAELTRHLLALAPTASIGYCSGETNALFAMGAWNDMEAFRKGVHDSRFYDVDLCGELSAVRTAWGLAPDAPVAWAIWRVRAPLADVRRAVGAEARVHVTIVNGATDVIIGGDPTACARVTASFGPRATRVPGYDFVMHCPEARVFTDKWRALHRRATTPVPGVRFYTHATLSSYDATDDAAADALTGQAMNTVDFPALIERAWADGVRVFVEHGPHGGCTKWIDDALGARDHVAVALDRYGRSSLAQVAESVARLAAHGVGIDLAAFAERLTRSGFDARHDADDAKPSHRLRIKAHADPLKL